MATGSITIQVRILDLVLFKALAEALTDSNLTDDQRNERALELLAEAKPQIVEDIEPQANMAAMRQAVAAIKRASGKSA